MRGDLGGPQAQLVPELIERPPAFAPLAVEVPHDHERPVVAPEPLDDLLELAAADARREKVQMERDDVDRRHRGAGWRHGRGDEALGVAPVLGERLRTRFHERQAREQRGAVGELQATQRQRVVFAAEGVVETAQLGEQGDMVEPSAPGRRSVGFLQGDDVGRFPAQDIGDGFEVAA